MAEPSSGVERGDRPTSIVVAQAQAYADVVDACLAGPACRGITVWGLSDAVTWLDDFLPGSAPKCPLLFDEDLALEPA